MKKSKNEELNFLYLGQEKEEKENKKKEKKEKKEKAKIEKKNKKSKKGQTETTNSEEQLFNFDNEMVIGITKLSGNKKQKNKKNKKETKSKSKNKKDTKQTKNKYEEKNYNENGKEKKSKRVIIFVRLVILIVAILSIILFFFASPLFDVTEIYVKNTSKLTNEEIINMSGIQIGDNCFKINNFKVENKIKENPYVESIKIERILPSTINIVVKERKATYSIKANDEQYAFINNQGYILEINESKEGLPLITSLSTEEIVAGGRLNDEDLEKLETILKITEIANGNQIGHLISGIDIASLENIILILENEKKTVYLGNLIDINTKMLYIKATLEGEKGIEGELFMDGKTNKEGEFLFREKV